MKNVRILLIALVILAPAMLFSQTGPKANTTPTSRRYVNLPGHPPQAPFSDAILVGDTLYVAGRLGSDPKTNKIPDDLDQEMRNLFEAFNSVLSQASMSMDDLVMVQVFCPDVSLYDRFNTVYKSHFGKDLPARMFVGSGPLLRGAHFEMNGIAVKR